MTDVVHGRVIEHLQRLRLQYLADGETRCSPTHPPHQPLNVERHPTKTSGMVSVSHSGGPSRVNKPVSEMSLPACSLPRPGDRVVWYQDARPCSGTLVAYTSRGEGSVINDFENPVSIALDVLRVEDPRNRRGANWEYLQPPATMKLPTEGEQQAFGRILEQRIPPGPAYIDLVREIWHRGFEVFLVGGTVRDVLAGRPAHDVDLVTTMPLTTAKPLLKAMYRHRPSIDAENGFVRLGGTPASGDPFVDLKMFSMFHPGASCALFGADFYDDLCFRDFSCNGVYYDPMNRALIDPAGNGIEDAEASRLRLVCDVAKIGPLQQAKIVVRYAKFASRGFTATTETRDRLQKEFLPMLGAMQNSARANYVRTQVLSKQPKAVHATTFETFKYHMIEIAGEDAWVKHFEILRKEILI